MLRPRLIERLNRGAESKLTLISAPAGFGKTALLAEWLAAAPKGGLPPAWVSLDQADNSPAVFWTYVISALQTVLPGTGATAVVLLQSPNPPPIEAILPTLLNELHAVDSDVMLVLDDYHLIEQRDIQDGMAFLLDHLPPLLHILIATRADPPLPLARLRARGDLVELRASDLRFLPEEAASYLGEAMGLSLASDDLAALEARTEGWIAGLQLAALSLQGRNDVSAFIAAFGGDDRYIVDYLVEEVLERQPPAIRRFLLQTSVLTRFNGALCDAILEEEGSRGVLERLERGNFFVVPLDDKRQWYRYHHLFADVLQAHLVDETPELVPQLHRRASEWHEQNSLPADAIRHALAANDLPRAAGLVELASQDAVRAHQLRRLLDWLKPIPVEIVRSMPVLSTYYAMALQGLGQAEASAARLMDAEWWLDIGDARERAPAPAAAMVVVDEEAFAELPPRIALARGYLAMVAGNPANAMEHASSGLRLLPEDEHHWRGAAVLLLGASHWAQGNLSVAQTFHAEGVASLEWAGDIVLALSTASHDADLLKARGLLTEAKRRYEHSMQLAAQYGDVALPGMAIVYFGLGDLCIEQGDLDSATRYLEDGDRLSSFAAQAGTPYRRHRTRARFLIALGDLDAAIECLVDAERVFVRGAVPDVRPAAAMKARVWISQGRLAEAFAWIRERRLATDDQLSYRREYEHMTLVRALLAQARIDEDEESLDAADGLLRRLLEAAEAGGRIATVIEACMLQALIRLADGDVSAALVPVKRALTLAEPEGYVRLFLDEGGPMRDLLERAMAANISIAYARGLFSAFGPQEEQLAHSARATSDNLTEQLTAREIEIMRLLATGMRNQEIADHLVISPSTVKRHIANAYGKLSANHRTEALRRATELNLL